MTQQVTDSLRLAAYLRVSTREQADGYGLDAQEADIRAWVRRAGHRIVMVKEDSGVSGTTEALDRDGLATVLGAVQAREVDGVVVARLDRLARTLTVQEAALSLVWRYRGRFFAADTGELLQDDPDDPMRTFVRQVMGAAAQLDRALILKRLRDGRRIKGEKGGYAFGAPPFGKRAEDHKLVDDAEEAETVRLIGELREAGASTREIVSELAAAGRRSKRGGAWHPETVRRVLERL